MSNTEIVLTFLKLCVPSVISFLFMEVPMAINYVIAGHLKDGTVLASIGIGCTALNLLAIAIFHGINSAQESLASQAYGSGRLDLCMVYLNRGRVCILAIQAPTIFLLYFFSKNFWTNTLSSIVYVQTVIKAANEACKNTMNPPTY